jgi:hypothetical protein
MSYESNIPVTSHFFAGEDKILSYEVFSDDGVTMEDVTSFQMEWSLRKTIPGKDPFRFQGEVVITKSTVDVITVTGAYNATQNTNTQRVLVPIYDIDTENMTGGRYVCSLKRMDAGLEAVLSHGIVEVLIATVR